MSKNKGITLIALVITIIIMLILVGVVIHELGSDNGIIVKARWAEFVTEYERVDEAKELYAAGKIIDRYDDEAKFTLKSLFSNVSYAEETNDMLYPVDLNQRFYISEALETLKDTICKVEMLEEYDLTDPEKVDLYRVDFGLLNDIEVKREYIINIVSGMLYYIDGEPYRDRIYHTLRYGSPKELNAPDAPDLDDPDNPGDPDLKIHYLSGFDSKEYTQKVKQSKATAVDLNPIEFRRENHTFLYWKDITEEKTTILNSEQSGANNDFIPKTEQYYGIANQLINILEELWETDILEIIEDNADYEPDPDDEEAVPDAVTQTKNEMLEYLSVYQAEIQAILKADMTMEGLAEWMISNTEYLTQLQEYESENWIPEDDEDEPTYITYADQEVVNMGDKDMWLEAVWAESYVILDANGGKINRKDQVILGVKEGEEYGQGLKDAARDGFVFAGWFTEKDGGMQKINSDIYYAADLQASTLYAHWEPENSPNLVTLTYDANGGKIRSTTETTLTEKKVKGTRIGTMPVVEKDGLGQGGWFTSREGGTQVTESTIIAGDMTVYGQWRLVRLELNGGELYHRYTRASDIEEKYNQWNPVRYGGLYVVNGQKIGKQAKSWQLPYTSSGVRGVRKVAYVTTPAGKQYAVRSTFKGWYTGQKGAGTKVNYGSKYYDLYGDTLYAYWREKYTINYDANSGQFGTNASNTWKQRYVFEGNRYPYMTRPKKAGYRFLGWYDAKEGGNKIELANAGYTVKDNQTLYAHWEKVEFTFEVSDITANGWTQKVTPISDLSGYSIRYQCSLSPKGTSGASVSTTTNTSVANKKDGTTYYVWAYVTRYSDKIYSDVMEVTTLEVNLEFKVNVTVTSTNYTGWKQNIAVTSGNSDGYTVRYCISESSQNDSSPSKTISTNPTGKKEATTYYVWAEATKSGKTFKSSNYAVVKTGHAHTGKAASSYGCYGGTADYCEGRGWCFIGFNSSTKISAKTYTTNADKSCVRGCIISKGDQYYPMGTFRIICEECGGYSGYGSYYWACYDCYNNNFGTITAADGTTYYNCLDGGNFYMNSGKEVTPAIYTGGKSPHKKTYQLICGKSERSTTATIKNF